jgi:hypothetical protein
MKLNKFQVSTVLYFKSGNSKKVDWIEERLVKKVKGETQELTEPLTLNEADAFFQGKFKDWKDKGTTIVRKNAKGENSVIPFNEIEYATVTVIQMAEEVITGNTQPALGGAVEPPTPPAPPVSNIKDHPAFKK